MLGSVPLTPKALDDYRSVVGDAHVAEIRELAAPLAGARVLHLNATSFGGGVAEILTTLVPLLNDVGLAADWQVIRGTDEFYQVTKAMHNSLQGMYVDWTPRMRETWLSQNRRNAELFDESYDFVIVHDPQPAALLASLREHNAAHAGGKWIWRCHIDLTEAQVQTWDLLKPYLREFDGTIFTSPDYAKEDLEGPQRFTVPPAIDPLSPKNIELPAETYHAILERYGIDHKRPTIAQISRFDRWKDPLGVIEVYRLVKRNVPKLQLVLVASMAHDDPEGWAWYERTVRRAGEDYDIHILSNLNGVGNVEVNAFQRASDVVIQKGIRKGFGIWISDAQWKKRPVVTAGTGGLSQQVLDERTGFLADSTDECAERAVRLTGGRKPHFLDTLAAAYAEVGRFDQALKTAREAYRLLRHPSVAETAKRVRSRIALYESGRPYRQPHHLSP